MEWLAENYGLVLFLGLIVGFALFGGFGRTKDKLKGWNDEAEK